MSQQREAPRDTLCDLTIEHCGDKRAIRKALTKAVRDDPDLLMSIIDEIEEANPGFAELQLEKIESRRSN